MASLSILKRVEASFRVKFVISSTGFNLRANFLFLKKVRMKTCTVDAHGRIRRHKCVPKVTSFECYSDEVATNGERTRRKEDKEEVISYLSPFSSLRLSHRFFFPPATPALGAFGESW